MQCPRCGGRVRHREWPNPDGRGILETFDKCDDCGWQSHFAEGGRVPPEQPENSDEDDDE